MEAALNGIASSSKHQPTKDAIVQAKAALQNRKEHGDAPVPYVREKCLAAIELAFDHGNDKTAHYAVEAVQAMLRNPDFHSQSIENPQHNLPTQVLHSMTGIAQWNSQLQCYCLTLMVEMICSTDLKVSLQEVEEALELCMRVYGSSKEECVRVSARASVSQSITSYISNRYAAAEESQDLIAIYLDVTNIIESYTAKLDQLTTANDQSVILFDAMNALLSGQPLTIQSHNPFVNILWEKLCPLLIRLLGVPEKNVSTSNTTVVSTEEPMGQGQISKFPLSPTVIANPEATRALYQILEQLIRLMAGIPSVFSVLEALFHKAFLFPKVEHRTEAIKIIRKVVSDPRRIADLISSAVRERSLSLWRMLVVCCLEAANPSYEISIDAVRTCGCMLQGLLDFSRSSHLMDNETKQRIVSMFASIQAATTNSFSARPEVSSVSEPIPSTEEEVESIKNDTEFSATLDKLKQKFGMSDAGSEPQTPAAIGGRRSTEYDETSEKITAKKFSDSLLDKIEDWLKPKSTLQVDDAILDFASSFYSEFSAVHNEVFKAKSKIQQEFLNTDAVYLTVYASLSLFLRGSDVVTWDNFKESVLSSGCVVYVSESWLQKVYDHINAAEKIAISGSLRDVIQDYDGKEKKLLSDVERLQQISQGAKVQIFEERLAARWFLTAAWDSIVVILSTFLGIKDRKSARQKVLDGIERSIQGMQILCTVSLELELGERCGWIFDKLVEASCDLEELRVTATNEENQRRSVVSRIDLISIQMVLDNAFVALHAPECWKHVIRCTEYVWELEKYIYGALCYDKPSSRFSFGKKKKEKEKHDVPVVEDNICADRSVEYVLADKELNKDNINKSLAVLIAKVDRFYSSTGRQLDLRSLRLFLIALVSASENRICYSDQKEPALAPPTNLLARISEVLSVLHSKPLVHQMLVWPVVSSHFIQASSYQEHSRAFVSALSDSALSLLIVEVSGMCFNQMLINPFQNIVCSDTCSPETGQQLISSLSDFVKTKSDSIGSGWKPLFGTLKAVRTSTVDDASVHWTALDVIGTYLGINKSTVLSWSLPDCIPCLVHFLQLTDNESSEIDDQLSEAALRLVHPIYSVILNLYRTPHVPNHNLLHRSALRSSSVGEVDSTVMCLQDTFSLVPPLSSIIDPAFYGHSSEERGAIVLESDLEVPLGPFPWGQSTANQTASIELVLSFVEQLCGTLVTAPPLVQPPLLKTIHNLLTSIGNSEFGSDTASFCISALLLPHVQMWLRRKADLQLANIKQAIGTCTQIVLEFIHNKEDTVWATRLLADGCRLAVECSAQPNELGRVGASCLRHLSSIAASLGEEQWMVLLKSLWDSCGVTLHTLRLLLRFCSEGEDQDDKCRVLVDCVGSIGSIDMMLSEQVFTIDMQKKNNMVPNEDEEKDKRCDIILFVDGHRYRIPFSSLRASLLAHQVVIQLIGSLLSPSDIPKPMVKIVSQSAGDEIFNSISARSRSILFYSLDASFQVAREFDQKFSMVSLISKCSGISSPNLFKQLVSAGLIKIMALLSVGKNSKEENGYEQFNRCLERLIGELKRVEQKTANQKAILAAREHKEKKLDFILVEVDNEKLYKVANEQEVSQAISDYKKNRPLGPTPISERKNPFVNNMSSEENSTETNDPDMFRLLAYRDICVTPIQVFLEEESRRECVLSVVPSIEKLILASPDLIVRGLAIQLIDILASYRS